MGGELKHKVATGVAWSIAEKLGSMLLQLGVSLVVLVLLEPDDFAVMAILTFFTSIALVVVDSGFSQTLIRKEEPTREDYGSVFIFNLAIAVVLYVLLTAAAPFVAHFYGHPSIAKIAPVLFLLFPINALCVVQNAIFTRQFRFGLLSRATFASSLAGGLAAVVMALAGCGVWSLAGQRIATSVAKTVILWGCNPRPPLGRFSTAAIREMAPFSFRLLGTDIVSSACNNIAQMFIGYRNFDLLGYFSQAQKLKDLPVTSAMQSVQSVTYPALARIGREQNADNDKKFAESYRQVLMTVAFMMFPAMAGLAAVAEELFMLLGEKWMPTVPYLQILALTGLFVPLSSISLNILKVRSDGRIIFNLEFLKKGLLLAIIIVTVMHSVKAVALGLVAASALEFLINITAARRYTALSLPRIMRTLLPVVLITAAMYAAVMTVGTLLDGQSALLRLLVKIFTGAIVYILSALAFRLESAREVKAIITRLFF